VEFSAARLARLYSVVVPAIALTFLLEAIGKAHNPAIYDPHHETMPLWRGLSALLFLSQSWGQDLVLLCNSAYWSLPYEFWYYVLFGAALFLRGKTRIIVILVAAAIASPGILLRFPVWLAGVAAYQASRKAPAGKYAPLLFALSLVIVAIGFWLRKTGITPVSDGRFLPYYFSLSDYVIGAGIALNLYAAAGFEMALLQRFKGFIRRTAGMTFSLYLFHQPIFYCVAAYLPAQMSSPVREAIMLTTALIACAVLSHYTEEKKGVLKNAFVVLFRGIQTRRSPVRAA